jgi:hypothetical protein
MPRKTNAQLAQEAEERRQKELEERLAGWPKLLMGTLNAATQENFQVEVAFNKFAVTNRDENGPVWRFGYSYDADGYGELADLACEVEYKASKRREREAKAAARAAALAKLTPEERTLLNLA